jgi:hypothetical protein
MGAFYNSEEIFLPKNIKVCQNLLTFVPRHGDKKSVPWHGEISTCRAEKKIEGISIPVSRQ